MWRLSALKTLTKIANNIDNWNKKIDTTMAEIRDLFSFQQKIHQEYTLWNRGCRLNKQKKTKKERRKLIGNAKQKINLHENSSNHNLTG